jgi:hypothetical protein
MSAFRTFVAVAAAALSLSAQAVGRQADIRIHDRTLGQDLPVYWHEGRAYVVGTPGNEYQVRIRNRRGEDLLAVVSVDGVNAVSGQTADVSQGGYVLGPRRNLGIQGWRKSLDETAAFYFTSLGDSYAARTGRPQNVGVIGVALFRRKPAEALPFESQVAPGAPFESRRERADAAEPPAAEVGASSAKRAAPSSPLGTGHGRRETSYAQWTQFERESSPLEVVTIYYDSHRNLVARGIVPPVRIGPRDPQPFPGFVRDPA